MKLLINTVLILILSSGVLLAQPIRETTKLEPDTTEITLQELLNPSFQNLMDPISKKYIQSYGPSTSKSVKLGMPTELLLTIGTQILRGDKEKYPLYSLKNAWRYPGPTVQYPISVSEYETFLQRYNKYASDF